MPNLGSILGAPIAGTRNSTYPALWYGIITTSTPTTVQVSVPALADEPLLAVNTLPNNLTPGDRVIVGLMEGRIDNLLILALMTPTVPHHTHTPEDITAPQWRTVPGTTTLRYQVTGGWVNLHGTLPTTGVRVPVTPARASVLTGHTTTGPGTVTLTTDGTLTHTAAAPVTLNGSAPLT